MAQPKKKSNLDQVLKLVDQLSSDELAELRQKLDAKEWGKEWRALIHEVDEQNKGLPPISEEEIMAEVKAVREQMKAERAQKSSH